MSPATSAISRSSDQPRLSRKASMDARWKIPPSAPSTPARRLSPRHVADPRRVIAEARLHADPEGRALALAHAPLHLEHHVVPVAADPDAGVQPLVLEQRERLARLELPLLAPAIEPGDRGGLEQRPPGVVQPALVRELQAPLLAQVRAERDERVVGLVVLKVVAALVEDLELVPRGLDQEARQDLHREPAVLPAVGEVAPVVADEVEVEDGLLRVGPEARARSEAKEVSREQAIEAVIDDRRPVLVAAIELGAHLDERRDLVQLAIARALPERVAQARSALGEQARRGVALVDALAPSGGLARDEGRQLPAAAQRHRHLERLRRVEAQFLAIAEAVEVAEVLLGDVGEERRLLEGAVGLGARAAAQVLGEQVARVLHGQVA